jgi:hypothetical protein
MREATRRERDNDFGDHGKTISAWFRLFIA